MKKVFKWIENLLVNAYAIAMFFLPLGGLIFLIIVVCSGVVIGLNTFGLSMGTIPIFAVDFLQIAWKIYIPMVAFIFFIMTTWKYQHCCVSINTFLNHLKHDNHLENVLAAIFWPYTIFNVGQNFRFWGMNWMLVAVNALSYWLIDRRKKC